MDLTFTGPMADAKYRITMNDGSQWEIPVLIIALNRAQYYSTVDEVELHDSLNNDTFPLFENNEDEIEDWAKNNMDWSDVQNHAVMVKGAGGIDYKDSWINGESEIT